MREDDSDTFRPGISFDPVCGVALCEERVDPFFDGDRIHYFCCLPCRRTFIDERRGL